jgi:competence protein ComEA
MGRMEAPDWRALRDRAMYWIAFVGPRRLVIGIVTTCVALVMLWLLVRPSAPPLESVVPQVSGAETVNSAASVSAPSTLTVHVAGAVKKPGVYVLSSAARVIDAVTAAGGPLASADLEGINLAQTLVDTEQIYIPPRSRRTTPVTVAPRLKPSRSTTPSTAPGSSGSTAGTTRVLNLNSATASELDALPGVGPATAKAIVDHRTKKGPFTKVEDLLNVAGIGPSKLAALRDQVAV